ncbi:protein of unknown function [Candidatus Nitrosacidococcus tergens]|uniref:Uncharacterized protein n=1 Tax=Candidatus Nitrosacidococcus tergens TaxID=553981 RepID=A0A7G1Q9Z4_9GAMM|nr:protein of unknown function [Candidatus Nitrosacidococcus tergens]
MLTVKVLVALSYLPVFFYQIISFTTALFPMQVATFVALAL